MREGDDHRLDDDLSCSRQAGRRHLLAMATGLVDDHRASPGYPSPCHFFFFFFSSSFPPFSWHLLSWTCYLQK